MPRVGSGWGRTVLRLQHSTESWPHFGHLDGDEGLVSALVRELREELSITVAAGDVRPGVVMHSRAEDEDDSDYLHLFFRDYLHLFFRVTRWRGTPVIAESDKMYRARLG